MNKKLIASIGVGVGLIASMVFTTAAFAQSTDAQNNVPHGWFSGLIEKIKGMFGGHSDNAQKPPKADQRMMAPAVVGIVSAINGMTLTVDGRHGTSTEMATTTYSVDATSAKIFKGMATTSASLADIAVGDKVVIRGTVTGTSVAATNIMDGLAISRMMGGRGQGDNRGQGRSGVPFGPRNNQ